MIPVHRPDARYTVCVPGDQLWALHATHGLPLEVALPLLADRGYVVSWLDLLAAAERDGANRPRLIRRLRDIITDSYEPDFAREVLARLPTT